MDEEVVVLNVPRNIARFTNKQRAAFKRLYEQNKSVPEGYESWEEFWNKVRIHQPMPRCTGHPVKMKDSVPVTHHDHQKFVRWWKNCFVGIERKKKWWRIF